MTGDLEGLLPANSIAGGKLKRAPTGPARENLEARTGIEPVYAALQAAA